MNEKEKLMDAYQMWTVYQPSFTSWNGALYESELIRAAISARARNVSKLKLEIFGSAQSPLKTMLKRRPNPLQTWSQFLSKASTILDMENTVFIMPWYDGTKLIGYLAAPPSLCQLRQIEDAVFLVYNQSVEPIAAEFAECGILTQHQYKSDLYGTSNKALNGTMELINLQYQGIQEAVKNSSFYRFMAKYTEAVFSKDLKEERKDFTKANLSGDDGNDGLLLFPNSYADIKQIENKQFVLDDKQMNFIRSNVYNYFGVNEEVLQNKAYGDAWIAFYEGAIEPFAIQFAEVFERMLFTDLELANGNGVMLGISRLEHIPYSEKIKASNEYVDRGVLSANEVREMMWNLPPREGGDTYAIRGEYKNTQDIEVTIDENTEVSGN